MGYVFLLGLVVKLYFISLNLRGKTEPPLLDFVKLTLINNYMATRIYQSSHQNTESNLEKKLKLVKR